MDNNHLKGKTLCFLGDSITFGVGVKAGERYFDILEKEIGFKAYGFGVDGAKYINLYSQAQKMHEMLDKNIDAIFIFAGTNDYNGSTPIGDWYDYSQEEIIRLKNNDGSTAKTETRKLRTFNFDTNTFKGSINTLLSYLKRNYADKQIILMTPLHRAYAEFSENNIQYDEMHSNHAGLFMEDYLEAIHEAAQIWATELIDLHSVSGLFPLYDEHAKYFANSASDRLHPGKEGHRKIAKVLFRKLNNIPIF